MLGNNQLPAPPSHAGMVGRDVGEWSAAVGAAA